MLRAGKAGIIGGDKGEDGLDSLDSVSSPLKLLNTSFTAAYFSMTVSSRCCV